nr:MAG TPA: hypothetical protein [Caudoviricetes sp.]
MSPLIMIARQPTLWMIWVINLAFPEGGPNENYDDAAR